MILTCRCAYQGLRNVRMSECRKILSTCYRNDTLEKLPLLNLLIPIIVCTTKAMTAVLMNGREIFSVSNNLLIELWRIPMTKRNIQITNIPPEKALINCLKTQK